MHLPPVECRDTQHFTLPPIADPIYHFEVTQYFRSNCFFSRSFLLLFHSSSFFFPLRVFQPFIFNFEIHKSPFHISEDTWNGIAISEILDILKGNFLRNKHYTLRGNFWAEMEMIYDSHSVKTIKVAEEKLLVIFHAMRMLNAVVIKLISCLANWFRLEIQLQDS